MLLCVCSAVPWACPPLWHCGDISGLLGQQPLSAGCGDARWQRCHLRCEWGERVAYHQQQVRTVCVCVWKHSLMLQISLLLKHVVYVFVQSLSEQTRRSSVAAQVDSNWAESNGRGEGRSFVLCVCWWQDQQMVCLQQRPRLHRYCSLSIHCMLEPQGYVQHGSMLVSPGCWDLPTLPESFHSIWNLYL